MAVGGWSGGGRGWPVAHGGRRGGRSERAGRVRSGWPATGLRGARACWTVPPRRGACTTAPMSRRCSCWPGCGGCGSPAPELADLLDMPLSTISAVLKRIGMGKLGRLGLEPAVRYQRDAARGADPHRRQEARPHPRRRRQTRSAARQHQPTTEPSDDVASRRHGLGRRSRRHRRRHAPRLRRSAARREGHDCGRIPWSRDRFLRTPRHPRRARDHRQRRALQIDRPRDRLPRHSASATYAPAPTGPRQTAKPNASSGPCSPAGPTARSTTQAQNAPPPLTAGFTPTTITADTQPSADKHRSPG